jgi:GT2 family glycosyltransferase
MKNNNQDLASQVDRLKEQYTLITRDEAWPVAKVYWSIRNNLFPTPMEQPSTLVYLQRLDTLPLDKQAEILNNELEILAHSRALRWAKTLMAPVKPVIRIGYRGFKSAYAQLKNLIPMRHRRQSRLFLEKILSYLRPVTKQPVSSTFTIAPPHHYDLICFPIIDWSFRFQRPQQLLTQFAKNGHRVFYISPHFNSLKTSQEIAIDKISPPIYGLKLPGYVNLNLYLDTLPQDVIDACVKDFERLRKIHGLSEVACLVQLPFWEPLARSLKSRYGWKIVYDCMDEHSGFSTNSPQLKNLEKALVEISDLVVVTAKKLSEKWQDAQPVLIPNGADYDHFAQLPSSGKIEHLSKPIIGYYGAIAEWFDIESVAYAATQKPAWNFVLIGHTFGANLNPLKNLPNVHFLGEQSYSELPAYLADFDVCTIPFVLSPLTEATHPVKFFEYISSGKAVVAANLPELEPYADIAYLYQGKEDFLAKVEQALAEYNPNLAEMRQTIAQTNTWENRHSALDWAIRNLYDRASIIIISYNNLDYTRQCLESILAKTIYPNYEVIVVDNNSQPQIKSYLAEMSRKHTQIKVIFNEKNLGFAAANNIGLQQCSESEYVILLNNDVVVSRGWLTRLLRHLRTPEIGMVGPVTNWTGNEAKIDVPYLHPKDMEPFAEAYTRSHEGQIFDIQALAMYCVALRREIADKVGPLDEQFGVGMFEDDDYAMRVRQIGKRVVCAEDAFVHHYGMASFSKLKDEEYQQLFERNKQLYEAKWGRWVPHQSRH